MDVFEQVKAALDENKCLTEEKSKLQDEIWKRNSDNYAVIKPKVAELFKLAEATTTISGVTKAATVIDNVYYEMGTSKAYATGLYINSKRVTDCVGAFCQAGSTFMMLSEYFGTALDARNTLSNICKLFEVYFDEVLTKIKGVNDSLTDFIANYKQELARESVKEDDSIEIVVDGKSYIARPKPEEDELA